MIEVEESWSIIERVLSQVVPHVYETLRPGASENEIARLEDVIGIRLPDEFRRSLSRHDGQNDPTRLLGLFNYDRLLPIDDIISESRMMQELFADDDPIEWLVPDKIRNVVWCDRWVKFTDSEGDGYVLDLSPGPNGIAGQVFCRRHDDNPVVVTASSFGGFLERVALLMEEGEYDLDDGVVVFDQLWQ